jgi:hypothetical protein
MRLTELMALADINNRPQVSKLVTYNVSVLGIRDILMRIRILGI